jgi:NAD(P)-dependent dehydrogenase (short-subunit alcohol dehydrogenase family)
MADAFRLDGKTALITGAASGIGAATARAFGEAGGAVIAVDLNADGVNKLAESIPDCRPFACDITDAHQVSGLFASISKLDILVNCAGIGLVGTVEETAEDDFDKLILVNVTGTFLMTKAALPLIKAAAGSILNIGSVAGLVGVKRRFAYCATKGAVIAMTRQLAVDYPTELRANCIAPGTVDSPFVEGYLEKYHPHEKEKVRTELNQRQPIGRLGKPEEIANLALYLSSPAAAFVHGSVVAIDGGWTAA